MTVHEEPGSGGALWYRFNGVYRGQEYAVVRVLGPDGTGEYKREEPAFSTMMGFTEHVEAGHKLLAKEQLSMLACPACCFFEGGQEG